MYNTGNISRRATLKALYHRGRLVELNFRQDPNSPQIRTYGHTIELWGIGEEIGQAIGGMKRGVDGKEPAARRAVAGAVNQ